MIDKISFILPAAMAAQALGAGIVYAYAGRWGSAGYWFSACAITIAVLLIPRYG